MRVRAAALKRLCYNDSWFDVGESGWFDLSFVKAMEGVGWLERHTGAPSCEIRHEWSRDRAGCILCGCDSPWAEEIRKANAARETYRTERARRRAALYWKMADYAPTDAESPFHAFVDARCRAPMRLRKDRMAPIWDAA